MPTRLTIPALGLAVAAGIAAPPAQADSLETIAYEGFDYSADATLTSLDGGSGWSSAWAYPQAGDAPLAINSSGLSRSDLGVPGTGLATRYRGVRGVNANGRDIDRMSSGVVYVQSSLPHSRGTREEAPLNSGSGIRGPRRGRVR